MAIIRYSVIPIYTRTHVHEIVYYEQPNAQTSLCIRAVSPGPLLLSYTMQMDGGIEVSLHKIYVSISVLNKTFANMRQVPKFRVLAHIWCWGV